MKCPSVQAGTDSGIRRSIGFFIAALGLLAWTTRQQVDLAAFGCDAFGYARQAELFRHNGLWGGLDTHIESAEVQQLIALAGSIFPDTKHWSEAIAPHGHHYNPAGKQVILQYPPGTGLVLSLFPERVALAYVFILGMTLVAAVFTAFIALYRPPGIVTVLAASLLALIAWTLSRPEAFASASIPITVSLIPLAAALSFAAFPGADDPGRKSLALMFGSLCGMLLSIRLPNAFLLAGFAFQLAFSMRLWRLASLRRAAPALLWALAGFLLTGPLPVLSANRINVGGIFSSTYSPIDASPPILKLDFIGESIRYYYSTGFAAPALIAASLVLLVRALARKRFPACDGLCGASLGGLAALAISGVFFSTHAIRVPYYLLPASVLSLCLVVFEIIRGSATRCALGAKLFSPAILILPLVLFALVRIGFVLPFTQKAILPQEVCSGKTIVWADLSSGTSVYYLGKYAAKIKFADIGDQNELIEGLSRLGWTQYFVADSEEMRDICRRLKNSRELSEAGVFDTFSSFPVWKLRPGSAENVVSRK